MNSLTMPHSYKLHLVNFQRALKGVFDQYPGLTKKVLLLIHQFEFAIGAENEITIKGWRNLSGEVFVTLEFPLSKIDLNKDQDWITRAFPKCNISGNLLELPFTS